MSLHVVIALMSGAAAACVLRRIGDTASGQGFNRELSTMTRLQSETQRSLNRIRVLLVEDCPDQLRLYANTLVSAGADVTLECDGASALATVLRPNANFDVVVTDLQMPVMDGQQAIIAMRHVGIELPIVVISASQETNIEAKMLESGCTRFLHKPIKPKLLIEEVRASLEQSVA
ncbi:MAG: response regulator [Planctomycetales bacterium]|nr:response regulator [Planctomycetales bacterium]